MSIKNEQEIKTFPDKQKLKKFTTSKTALQKCKSKFFKLKQKANRKAYKRIRLTSKDKYIDKFIIL